MEKNKNDKVLIKNYQLKKLGWKIIIVKKI